MDCPICLDELTRADREHPLQCERKCGYNFCQICIESLINSSKDDYQEASDGNYHVKIHLHCPNCRSDLSESIRDTLLLRMAETVMKITDESNLSASQLQLKSTMIDNADVRFAIEEARKMETHFLGQDITDEKKASECYEEEGLEVDLEHHMLFMSPTPPPPTADLSCCSSRSQKATVDVSLFAGFGYFLNDEEKRHVTESMTSGDPDKLAQAAHILSSATRLAKGGIAVNSSPPTKSSNRIVQLIAESRAAHSGKYKQQHSNNYHHNKSAREDSILVAKYSKDKPLPVRMPKHIIVAASTTQFPLEFVDDTWNGTVMDAFCKITVRRRIVTKKARSFKPAVRNVLGQGTGDLRVALETPRTVVSKVHKEAGRQGALKGDVLSHINGENILEKSAREVTNMLKRQKNKEITLVLNADIAIAEALKRRAMI